MALRKSKGQSKTDKGYQNIPESSQQASINGPAQAEPVTVIPEVVEELTEEEKADRQ